MSIMAIISLVAAVYANNASILALNAVTEARLEALSEKLSDMDARLYVLETKCVMGE